MDQSVCKIDENHPVYKALDRYFYYSTRGEKELCTTILEKLVELEKSKGWCIQYPLLCSIYRQVEYTGIERELSHFIDKHVNLEVKLAGVMIPCRLGFHRSSPYSLSSIDVRVSRAS